MQLPHRPRRLRYQAPHRNLVRETHLLADDLIYPVFVLEGQKPPQRVQSMPGVLRFSLDDLLGHLNPLVQKGLNAVALFPVVDLPLKSYGAEEAWNQEGLVQRTIARLKLEFPHVLIISDVALDPYTSHGQDGIIDDSGYVLNDETVRALVLQALSHARAGADIVAPSDMMDGRIGAIRNALEAAGFIHTAILSYAAKYASALYGPFRDAVGSAIALDNADKNSYQMDPANRREALREVALDVAEGADLVMVKPALPYLDVIADIRATTNMPICAYQVSGEYAMLRSAIDNGWLAEDAIGETLLSIKRAGADAIFSYFTPYCLNKLIR